MALEDLPELAALKPRPEELEAVRLLARQRGMPEPLAAEDAVRLLDEVRLNQAKVEFEALRWLHERTRTGLGSRQRVDRVYRPYLVVVALALAAYILMRIFGGG